MCIDQIYKKIACNISDAIDAQWSIAVVIFDYEEDAGEFECVYKNGSGVEHDFDISYETYKSFESLYAITTEGKENQWDRARFTLYPTGKFNIEFTQKGTL